VPPFGEMIVGDADSPKSTEQKIGWSSVTAITLRTRDCRVGWSALGSPHVEDVASRLIVLAENMCGASARHGP
jgi:hypothetical protein